jgi:hypothetical protein
MRKLAGVIIAIALIIGGIVTFSQPTQEVTTTGTVTAPKPGDLKVEPRTGRSSTLQIQPAARATPEAVNGGTIVTTFQL